MITGLFFFHFYAEASNGLFLAKYQKKNIDSAYPKVMSSSFDVKKNKATFLKFLKDIVYVSSRSKDYYMGSYVAELLDVKKVQPEYLWRLVSSFATQKEVQKLKRDYRLEALAGLKGQDSSPRPARYRSY